MKKRRIVIKIGTNSISGDDGTINQETINHIVEQVCEVRSDSDVLIITSGAVGAGKNLLRKMDHDEVTNKQIYAAVGQIELMKIYSHLFGKRDIYIAQMLATRADFTSNEHSKNMQNCLKSLFEENIVPVMNENDFVAVEELMFSDNDELAKMVCQMIKADYLVILSNVKGIYDEDGKVIDEFNYDSEMPGHLASSEKSAFGTGGIQSKFGMSRETAEGGTEVFIADSKEPHVILRIMKGEHIGTKFNAKK